MEITLLDLDTLRYTQKHIMLAWLPSEQLQKNSRALRELVIFC